MSDHEDHEYEEEEGEGYEKKVVTSTISARGGEGRNIYIYLEASDSMEFRDLASTEGELSWVRVEVDMEGHRHWQVKLAPADSLGTGRPVWPPPPPPNGG